MTRASVEPGRRRAGWRRLGAEVVRVNPPPYAHRVALRAGVTVLVPLLVLWTVDRLDLSLYATFGAFASVYGGGRR